MRSFQIILVGCLLVSGMLATNNPLTAQTWLDRVREKSMDVWYGTDEVFFTVDADGSWRKVDTETRATHYRVSRQNRKGEIRGSVKFYDVETDALYWEGAASSLDPLMPEGKVVTYHTNGKIWQEINYENGKFHGDYAEYSEWGGDKMKGTYANGKAHGLFVYDYGLTEPSQIYVADQLIFEDFKINYHYGRIGLEGFKRLSKLMSSADAALSKGAYSSAIYYYNQVLTSIPDLPITLVKRGEAYYRSGKMLEAKNDLKKALINGYSNNYWTQYLLGRAENEYGSHYAAIVTFFNALKNIPDTPYGKTLKGDIYHQMGIAYAAVKEYKKASSYYQKALEIDPQKSYLHADIARALALDPTATTTLYHATMALRLGVYDDKEKSDLLAIRGHANLKNGSWSAAAADVTQALNLNQESSLAHGLFLEIYPAATYNSGGSLLTTLFIAIALWEINAIRNLVLAGRYWAAASEVAGNIIIGEGFEYVKNQINENSGMLIRSSSNKPLDDVSLSYHKLIKTGSASNIKANINHYKDNYDLNYHGMFEVDNKSYFHMNNRILNNGAYEEHYVDTDPWEVFEDFDNSKGIPGSKYISNIDYVNGKWHGVARWNTENVEMMFGVYSEYPMDKIRKQYAAKYKIMDLDYGDGKWVVAYMKFKDRLFAYRRSQFVQAFHGFPEKAIKEYWNAGYYISTLKFVEDKWILVMTKYRGRSGFNFQQRLLVDNNFPEDLLKKHESQGYGVQSITYGRNLYALVINKEL